MVWKERQHQVFIAAQLRGQPGTRPEQATQLDRAFVCSLPGFDHDSVWATWLGRGAPRALTDNAHYVRSDEKRVGSSTLPPLPAALPRHRCTSAQAVRLAVPSVDR